MSRHNLKSQSGFGSELEFGFGFGSGFGFGPCQPARMGRYPSRVQIYKRPRGQYTAYATYSQRNGGVGTLASYPRPTIPEALAEAAQMLDDWYTHSGTTPTPAMAQLRRDERETPR